MERMEKEIAFKIFMVKDYNDKKHMKEDIKEYIKKLKKEIPTAAITREFYKGENILVRATEINNKTISNKNKNKEREIDDWYIRQRGER